MASKVCGKAIRITDGNINNNHIPVAQIVDLFPADCIGGSNKTSAGIPIQITLDGVGTFETDIAGDKKLLRIREQGAVGEFYKHGGVKHGSRVFFERTGPRSYRITAIN